MDAGSDQRGNSFVRCQIQEIAAPRPEGWRSHPEEVLFGCNDGEVGLQLRIDQGLVLIMGRIGYTC